MDIKQATDEDLLIELFSRLDEENTNIDSVYTRYRDYMLIVGHRSITFVVDNHKIREIQ